MYKKKRAVPTLFRSVTGMVKLAEKLDVYLSEKDRGGSWLHKHIHGKMKNRVQNRKDGPGQRTFRQGDVGKTDKATCILEKMQIWVSKVIRGLRDTGRFGMRDCSSDEKH